MFQNHDRVRIIAQPSSVWPEIGTLGTVVPDVTRHNGHVEVRPDGTPDREGLDCSWPYRPEELESLMIRTCAECGEYEGATLHTDTELHPSDAADGLSLHPFDPGCGCSTDEHAGPLCNPDV